MKKHDSKKVTLVKYSDNDLRGKYIFFFVNPEKQKVYADFESEEEANKWLTQLVDDNR